MVIIKRTEAKVWGKLIITHAYPREITYLLHSIYIQSSFYLYTYSLLFTLGSCIIDILEKSNYHRDETNLSSR